MRKLTAIFLLVFSGIAHAEPDAAAKWAMNTPVSLFTYGMHQLQKNIQELFKDKKGSPSVLYKWKENQILIFVNVFDEDVFSESECAQIMNTIREDALIDGRTGKSPAALGMDNGSIYPDFYTQYGHSVKGKPENYYKSIDNMIYIQVAYHVVALSTTGTLNACEGPLVSNKVLYSRI